MFTPADSHLAIKASRSIYYDIYPKVSNVKLIASCDVLSMILSGQIDGNVYYLT